MTRSNAAARQNPSLVEVKRREFEQQLVAHRICRSRIGEVLGKVSKDHFAIR